MRNRLKHHSPKYTPTIVACPSCGARSGTPCVTRHPRLAEQCHPERVAKFRRERGNQRFGRMAP